MILIMRVMEISPPVVSAEAKCSLVRAAMTNLWLADQGVPSIEKQWITIRYPDNFEQHRWESAAMDADGQFFRSPAIKPITLLDRLGGGDTWNAGFYYGLLSESDPAKALQKGLLVGDAATRIKQTLMFDLPLVDKDEVQALMKEDLVGGGKRTVR